MKPEESALFYALGEFEKFAQTMTGMRQQLINMGWSEDHAEELVIVALRSGSSN